MICQYCGTQLKEGVKFCHVCGNAVEAMEPVEIDFLQHVDFELQPTVVESKENCIPPEYEPLSAWSFFWLRILFAIPVVGLVFLIIFSCSSGNLSRRSFARSYWCGLLICGIVAAAILSIYLLVMIVVADAYSLYY